MRILTASDFSPEAIGAGRVANTDMTVVGAYTQRRLAQVFEGSVARDIVRHSDVPVARVPE